MLLLIRVISRIPRANSRANRVPADVPLVTHEATEQALGQGVDRLAVVGVAGREAQVQQLALVADDQVELEPVEPPGGRPAAGGQARHDPVAVDPRVVAHPQRRGVDEADARAGSQAGPQVSRQPQQGVGHPLHEAVVADQPGELAPQVGRDVPDVEVLERAVARAVEQHQDRHDLAEVHRAGAVAARPAVTQQVPPQHRLEPDGELVQVVEQCDDVHRRPPCW
jgi:hypothetical protein